MAEITRKIIDKDRKISDKAEYLLWVDGIINKNAERLIIIIPIIKIILNKILALFLCSKIDFLFSFCNEIFILSQT